LKVTAMLAVNTSDSQLTVLATASATSVVLRQTSGSAYHRKTTVPLP